MYVMMFLQQFVRSVIGNSSLAKLNHIKWQNQNFIVIFTTIKIDKAVKNCVADSVERK